MPDRDPFELLYDCAITAHGFEPSMRDYRIEVERWTDTERGEPWTYRFSHCVFAEYVSLMTPNTWEESWITPTNLVEWEASGSSGFAWGVNWANIDDAKTAVTKASIHWSDRLGRRMHEAVIDTQVYRLRLIYHKLQVVPRPPPDLPSTTPDGDPVVT